MKVYLCVLETVRHPETGEPICEAGGFVTQVHLVNLAAEFGMDNVKVLAVMAETDADAVRIAYPA